MVSGLFLVACFWWLYLGGFFRVKFMSFRASYTYGGFTSKVSQLLVLIWQSFFGIVPILPLVPIMHILLVSCFIMLRGLICPITWNWTLPTPTSSSDNILYPFWKWVNWALNCWMVLGFRMVSSDLWFSDQDYILLPPCKWQRSKWDWKATYELLDGFRYFWSSYSIFRSGQVTSGVYSD